MTRATIRRLGHQIIEALEFINVHAAPRKANDGPRLEASIDTIEKAALKMIDAPLRPPAESKR